MRTAQVKQLHVNGKNDSSVHVKYSEGSVVSVEDKEGNELAKKQYKAEKEALNVYHSLTNWTVERFVKENGTGGGEEGVAQDSGSAAASAPQKALKSSQDRDEGEEKK